MYTRLVPMIAGALLLLGCAAQPATDIKVLVTDFAYTPSSITIPVNKPVVLTIENTGQVEHDFVVQEIDVKDVHAQDDSSGGHHMQGMEGTDYDLHVSTGAGQTNVLEFTALKPGTYRIFCSIEGHIESGMLGELIVAADS